MTPGFLRAFDALPRGHFTGTACGRRYGVTRQSFANGRAWKLVAEERGGRGYVSLNLCRLGRAAHLRPCKMPAEKAMAFVLSLRPDP